MTNVELTDMERRRPPGLRLLATVTFNENQLRAHLLPLISLPEVESITLVSDAMPTALPKVRGVVPSPWMRRAFGRAGAKLAVCWRLARTQDFDWIMGFNFVPHGFNAQFVAQRVGTRSLYHMIGGPREWLGGGYSSDNKVLGRLPTPIPLLEKLIIRQMSNATVVATMGPCGRAEVVVRGVDPARVAVIPPSTDVDRFRPQDGTAHPRYDLVTVAALRENKRLCDLIDAIALLRDRHPSLRVAVAGAGPLLTELQERARGVGVDQQVAFLGHVTAIESLYAGATAFVLCSRSEGMPISMLDAMAAGVPPVVTEVGEIGALVEHGRNGCVYRVGDVYALAGHLDALLSDQELASRLATEARRDVVARYSVDAVAKLYRNALSLGDG